MELIFLTILFQNLPFIYSISIDRREQFTAITSNYHVVDENHEKYQLQGGEWHLKLTTTFYLENCKQSIMKETIIDLT